MNEIKVFENSEFGKLKIITIEGKEYFPAAECAKILGYANPGRAIQTHCPHVTKRSIGVQTGFRSDGTPAFQNVAVSFIPEGDLYRLIIRSKLPSAERFEKWLFEEILPTIRKTGGYVSDDEMFIRTYLPGLGEAEKAIFKTTLSALKSTNEKIAADAPKVRFAESVSASADTILISDLAKLLKQNGVDIGRDRLFARLREEGYLCSSSSERNMPTQYAMNLGLFQVDERTWRDPYGVVHTNFTTRVTGKGQMYFIRRYCNSNG